MRGASSCTAAASRAATMPRAVVGEPRELERDRVVAAQRRGRPRRAARPRSTSPGWSSASKRDDEAGARERRRERRDQRAGDVGRVRRLAERLRQLVPAPDVLALRLDLAPRAHDRPAEQRRARRSPRCAIDASSSVSARRGEAKTVLAGRSMRERPARRLRVGIGDDAVLPAVQARRRRTSRPAPELISRTSAVFSAGAKVGSVSCCPSRSSSTRSLEPERRRLGILAGRTA